MKIFFSSTMLIFVLLIGCASKSQDSSTLSVNDLLTLGNWTSTRDFEDIDLNGTYTEFGEDCDKDNYWAFGANQTLVQGLGIVLCNPDDDDPNETIISKWRLEENDQYLVLVFPFDEVKFLINSVDEHEMLLSVVDIENIGIYTHRLKLNR